MPKSLFPKADAATRARLEADDLVHLTNSYDWSTSPIGVIPGWPEPLRAAVRLMLLSEVPMFMIIGAGSGIFIYNRGYAEFAGDRHPGIFGKHVLDAWPEIADFNREVMRRGFEGESWYLTDHALVLNRTGRFEPAWMNINCSPVVDEAGLVLAVVGVVVETTRRVRAERALARSQEKLELALDASGLVGIWDWDLEEDRVTADERFARLFSVDPVDAIRGLPVETFFAPIHPDDRARVQQGIADALHGRASSRFEYRLVQHDGSIRWVVASGAVQRDAEGRPRRFPGVVVDVTAQRLAQQRLAESEQRFRTLADTMPQMVWSATPDGAHDYFNARWFEFTGLAPGLPDPPGWMALTHAEDRDAAIQRWQHALDTGERYEAEHRLRHHTGEWRWVLGQALPIHDEFGRVVRWFGTLTDIHEARLVAEEREMVAQELSHRIKNIFAVISGIVGLAARGRPEATAFANDLKGRIIALSKAHDFVRRATTPDTAGNPHSLRALIAELMSPYATGDADRVVIAGADATINEAAATPIALIFHELATNAAKYGALSVPTGRVEVLIELGAETCALLWRERGGPRPSGDFHEGFGSKLMQLSVEGQLRGQMDRRWTEAGLEVALSLPLAVLGRSARLRSTPDAVRDPETA